jgi:hypothetical protein
LKTPFARSIRERLLPRSICERLLFAPFAIAFCEEWDVSSAQKILVRNLIASEIKLH